MNSLEIMKLNNRISLLAGRDPVTNMRIINKLKRRMRRLETT